MQTSNRLFALVSALVLFTGCQVPVAISEQVIQPTSVPTNPPEQQLHPTAVPPVASPSSTANLPSLAASSSTSPVSISECAIDVHSHLDVVGALNTETTFLRSAENAIAIMD
ncbi:MAG: hypothetical protein MUO64_11110, partial [Anaerolineales bacterium]|nr:hypothetical protein [Anaerolineales bacterium]